MDRTVRIAIAGAGLIGKRHIEAVMAEPTAALHAIVDPADTGRAVAEKHGVAHYRTLEDLLSTDKPDGIILATPNQMHVSQGLMCVEAGVPALVEKPVAIDLDEGQRLIEAGRARGVPLAVGHHRRHNPLVAAAKAQIDSGILGAIVAVHGMFWLAKPEDYFSVSWRCEPGGGPIYLNLIHDIDLLRHFVGEIVSVHAVESNEIRGHAVEDTAAILLTFASGALGTFSVSDTIVSPWSWELTAAENPDFPATGQPSFFIGGTQGSLEFPGRRVWSYAGERGWTEPISATSHSGLKGEPLVRQVAQFVRVIKDGEAPLCAASEGLKNVAVIEAIKRSAASGKTISL